MPSRYKDGDGDGHGDSGTAPIDQCGDPGANRYTAGQLSSTAGDCDDSDASVYPSAPELCDGQVNNCGTSLG